MTSCLQVPTLGRASSTLQGKELPLLLAPCRLVPPRKLEDDVCAQCEQPNSQPWSIYHRGALSKTIAGVEVSIKRRTSSTTQRKAASQRQNNKKGSPPNRCSSPSELLPSTQLLHWGCDHLFSTVVALPWASIGFFGYLPNE